MSRRRDTRTVWAVVVTALVVILAGVGWLAPRAIGLGATRPAAAGSPTATPATSTSPSPATSTSPSSDPSPSAAAGNTGPLHLVGFGDSVLAGAGCDCDDYLVQAATRLHHDTGRRVTTTNRGANGETAADLLHELRTDDKATAEVKQADAIVLTIGANDLQSSLDTWSDKGCNSSCYQPEIASMANRLDSVLAIIDRAKKPDAVVLVTNYWNVYLDGDVGKHTYGTGYLSWSDTVTRAANTAICRSADQAQATCVDLYQPFKGDGGDDPTGLLADDGDHANARGTAMIARVVAKAIEQALPGDSH